MPAPLRALCRDCCTEAPADRPTCPACGSRRLVRHAELFSLTVAHIDCDAFYASVEKRDRPELLSKPVIVGGGTRGVVSAACYLARTTGVRSAMPMFKALRLCPDAVVIKPDMAKYVAAARRIRGLMEALTPLVQPLSIDEAVLDLAGTQALHRAPPAIVLARFAREVEREVGVTVSIGLAPNRLLAKLTAERDKPRGFAVLGADEAAAWLAPQPVSLLPGVGPALQRRLEAAGFTRLGQLGTLDAKAAAKRFGEEGPGLAARARGEDTRRVDPVLRRCAGHQAGHQPAGGGGHLFHGSVEGRGIGLGRHGEAAELAHELQRRVADLQLAGRRLEVEQGADVAAHGGRAPAGTARHGAKHRPGLGPGQPSRRLSRAGGAPVPAAPGRPAAAPRCQARAPARCSR